MLPDLIREIGILKKTAALVNRDLRKLPKEKADLIIAAADEVVTGKLHEQFPQRFCQTGTDTQTNMNANEVISNRAIEMAGGKKSRKKPICPNDDVSISQSYNDTFPTAMYVAAAIVLTENLAPALKELHAVLETKSQELAYIAKIERTHALGAAPLTVDQGVSGSSLIERDLERIRLAIDGFYSLATGGKGAESASELPAGRSRQWQNVEVVHLISNLLRLARRSEGKAATSRSGPFAIEAINERPQSNS